MTEQKQRTLLEIVVPTAQFQDFSQAPARHAQRPRSLDGRRVLVLPSEQASSPPFAEALARRLGADTAAAIAFMRKPDWAFFHPARAARIGAEVEQMARECDLMVTGVAY